MAQSSCGGGGGGGDTGSGGGSGGGGANTSTGLIPVAPQLGETLFAEARSLRPMVAGGRWEYRGTSTAYSGAAPVAYVTTTTHTNVTSAGATETTTNSGNTGPEAQPIQLSNGRVLTPLSVDFAGKGTPQTFDFVELRSPVRTGDQYVMVDQRYADTNIDADRDGKADALDVAIFAQVIGRETVSLPNVPTVSAVRVDVFILSRVIFSSNGAAQAVQQTSFKTWYAPGIGIVRQVVTTPASVGADISVSDDKLISFDGGNSGFGVMPAVDAVIPASSSSFPGQTIPGSGNLYAFAYGSYALVFSDSPAATLGTLATTIDLRGQVLATTLLPDLRMGGGGLALASSSGVVYIEPATFGAARDYLLSRLDTQGRLLGAPRAATLNLGGSHIGSMVERLAAAADGTTLWLAWSRRYYDPGNGNVPGIELVLRAFGFDGAPLAAEQILDTTYSGDTIKVSAAGGQAVVTWVRGELGREANYAVAALGSAPVVRTLGAGQPSGRTTVTPVRVGSSNALLWPEPLAGATTFGVSTGVLLDAAAQPVLAGTSVAAEVLNGVPPFLSALPTPAGVAQRIVVLSTGTEFLWSGDPFTQAVDTVTWIDVGTTPLSTSRIAGVRMSARSPLTQAVFQDRVLVFGGIDRLKTSVVWLSSGS